MMLDDVNSNHLGYDHAGGGFPTGFPVDAGGYGSARGPGRWTAML
jgi:hypothetical protein